jgi:transposase
MKRLQGGTILPRRRAKRQHYEAAFKRHLVELTLVPGASVARIALDHRLNANILFRWRRQYLREVGSAPPKPAAALLPVAVVSDAAPALDLISAGVPSPRARSTRKRELGLSGVIEIELAGAQVRVTGAVSLEALRLVLETLSK